LVRSKDVVDIAWTISRACFAKGRSHGACPLLARLVDLGSKLTSDRMEPSLHVPEMLFFRGSASVWGRRTRGVDAPGHWPQPCQPRRLQGPPCPVPWLGPNQPGALRETCTGASPHFHPLHRSASSTPILNLTALPHNTITSARPRHGSINHTTTPLDIDGPIILMLSAN
jgi:hypothetical protein